MKHKSTLLEKIITGGIVAVILVFIVIGGMLMRGCVAAQDKGLKHLINEAWEGKPAQPPTGGLEP